MKKVCPFCKTEFERTANYSNSAWDKRVYCSHSCATKAKCPFHSDPIARCKFFLTKTVKTATGCLEWQGAKNREGYGTVQVLSKLWRAPRAIYHYLVAPIPEGMFICHKCDNPACINPDHLFVGTRHENNMDSVAKGRWAGVRNLVGHRPWENITKIELQNSITI